MSNLLPGVPAPFPQIELDNSTAALSGFLDRGSEFPLSDRVLALLIELEQMLAYVQEYGERGWAGEASQRRRTYQVVVNAGVIDDFRVRVGHELHKATAVPDA